MNLKCRQNGSTLIVALVMLVVLTLLVISAMRSGNTNLRIVGNMQVQEEAAGAGQQAVEQIISKNFTANPVSSVISVDVNNDGTSDYDVNVAKPACMDSAPIMNSSLDMTKASDVPCFSSSTASNTGIIAASGTQATTGQSWCFTQQWEVQTQTSSRAGNGANAVIHQGVSLRVPAGTTC